MTKRTINLLRLILLVKDLHNFVGKEWILQLKFLKNNEIGDKERSKLFLGNFHE